MPHQLGPASLMKKTTDLGGLSCDSGDVRGKNAKSVMLYSGGLRRRLWWPKTWSGCTWTGA